MLPLFNRELIKCMFYYLRKKVSLFMYLFYSLEPTMLFLYDLNLRVNGTIAGNEIFISFLFSRLYMAYFGG